MLLLLFSCYSLCVVFTLLLSSPLSFSPSYSPIQVMKNHMSSISTLEFVGIGGASHLVSGLSSFFFFSSFPSLSFLFSLLIFLLAGGDKVLSVWDLKTYQPTTTIPIYEHTFDLKSVNLESFTELTGVKSKKDYGSLFFSSILLSFFLFLLFLSPFLSIPHHFFVLFFQKKTSGLLLSEETRVSSLFGMSKPARFLFYFPFLPSSPSPNKNPQISLSLSNPLLSLSPSFLVPFLESVYP